MFYNLAIIIYISLIKFFSLFNKKARLWYTGRKNIFAELERTFPVNKPVIWMHCASLGEFEQGRPLIEKIKEKNSSYFILLTFFSPSGYEVRKNYTLADYVCYLPADTPSNVRKFLALIKPVKVYFVKYEFWRNYLQQLYKNQIDVFLISAIFRNNQLFFKWYGAFYQRLLFYFKKLFVQDKKSKMLLERIRVENVIISGDTRFDRVYEIKDSVKSLPALESFKGNTQVLIAGSTWEPDEKIILKYFQEQQYNLKLIIAPHEVHKSNIQRVVGLFGKECILYSKLESGNTDEAKILLVDTMGHLSSLYQYGDIAFIGGGFGKGIHNTLEAATFGLPVFFGPNYKKFKEARELIDAGGGFSISQYHEFKEKVDHLLESPELLKNASSISANYVKSNTGSTLKIIENSF